MTIYNFEGCLQNFQVQANCILSLKITNNENFDRIITLKKQIFENKIKNNDFNFSGANLINFEISNLTIHDDVILNKSVILENVIFKNIQMKGDLNCNFSKIGGEVIIGRSNINHVRMYKICIYDRILITESNISAFYADGDFKDYEKNYDKLFNWNSMVFKIKKYVLSLFKKDFYAIEEEYAIKNGLDIVDSKIGVLSVDRLNIGESGTNGIFMELVDITVNAHFMYCNIIGNIWIRRVVVEWDCLFDGSRIKSGFDYELSKVKGQLNLNNTIFYRPYAQENASREAKRVWNGLGDNDKADQYYFKEMEGKRKNKGKFKYIEWLIIQLPFGYGVKLYRIIVAIICFILFFAFIFWLGNGIQGADSFSSNLYVSMLTALKIGSSGYQPVNKYYQLVLTFEAIGGTFLWSISIVIFAKKFIR